MKSTYTLCRYYCALAICLLWVHADIAAINGSLSNRSSLQGILTAAAEDEGASDQLESLPADTKLSDQLETLEPAATSPEKTAEPMPAPTKAATAMTPPPPMPKQQPSPKSLVKIIPPAATIAPAAAEQAQPSKPEPTLAPEKKDVPDEKSAMNEDYSEQKASEKTEASAIKEEVEEPTDELTPVDNVEFSDEETQDKAAVEKEQEKTEQEKTPKEITKKIKEKTVPEKKEVEIKEPKPTPSKKKAAPSEEDDTIEFNFEDADLQNLVSQVSELYHLTFIADDIVTPLGQGAKALQGNKISFKTQKPLSRKQAWNLFITFLDIAGFAIVPTANPKFFKITVIPTAQKSPIPSYIGTDPTSLPDNDQIIRYVYFIENSTVDAIKSVVDQLKSADAPAIALQETKAVILTDKAYNIKALMKIIKEIDKVTMPQAMSVLKLKRADALQVKELYDSIAQTDDKNISARLFPARKQPTSLYFPENTRIFAEPRTNTLILLGPQDAIKKIEDFVVKYVDIDLDQPYSPYYTYQLKYADATTIADIMNSVTQFGRSTEAGKNGGVRGEDKYLKPITFIAEKSTNRIIIKGEFEDYLQAKEIIQKLDEQQPQVAMEVLILLVTLNDKKELGVQLRSKETCGTGMLGNNVKFQTSGLRAGGPPQGIVENPDGNGVKRLLGNLISLINGAVPGNTVVTLGADQLGIWGVFQALQTISNLQVISNPFITATNKTEAEVSIGEVRRVITSTVIGTNPTDSFGDQDAKLDVKITPQINSDGMISLKIDVLIEQFTSASDQNSANKTSQQITTNAIVADKEVLALGGLIKNLIENNASKTPLLGDIPILGWFFQNRQKRQTKSDLLILISTQILRPESAEQTKAFTKERLKDYNSTLAEMEDQTAKRDPIHKMFFAPSYGSTEKVLDDFMMKRKNFTAEKPEQVAGKKDSKKSKKLARRTKKSAVVQQSEPQPLLAHDMRNNTALMQQSFAYSPQAALQAQQAQRANSSLMRFINHNTMGEQV